MQILIACFVGLMLSVGTGAEPVVEGQVRLAAGESVAGAQVLLFDLGNLRRGAVAQATTDAAGAFVLSLGMRPAGFGLGQNYPNPFNPSTIIPYELAAAAQVRLEVFNSVGQRVATLVDGEQPAGAHRVRWNGTDAAGRAVAAGVYLYRLTANGTSQTGRMVLVDGQAGFDKTSASSVEPLSPQSAPTASWAEPVEAHPTNAAYGLVVSGVGLETYVDAEFRVEGETGPVVVDVDRAGRGKATQTRSWILGDVDNTGQVTLADALLVIAYSLDSSIAIPNNGDIRLGDVNEDGKIDAADAMLITKYSINPADPALPSGIGQPWPAEAGLLTIPPLTLTVGSSYIQWIKERSSPVAGEYYYDISSSDPTVADGIVSLASRASDDGRANEQWGAMVITGVGLGTAQVTLKSTFGDPQTIPVTVVERPPSIDSVPAGQSKTENITLVFYKAKGVLDSIEEKIPWYYLDWRLTLGTVDLLLEWLGFGSTEVEREQASTTWVEYAHDDDISYALSQQSVELYKSTSGLREEAFVVLQDAKKNVLQDVVLALVPGLLSWPATAISIIGDLQMYASILDVVLANELKSTKAELYGLLAPDGSIIEGNSYRPFLMMKNDEADRAVALDLRLHVTQAMDIESVGKKVRVTESTDFGPITVPAGSGYQILSNQSRVFADEARKKTSRRLRCP